MKKRGKINFTKLTHRKGVSLIVLIVTIIILIILAAAVILTLSKNNPIESAREARFKEDMRNIQDELSMYLSSKYTEDLGDFDPSTVNLNKEKGITNKLPSTERYEDIIEVQSGKLVYKGENKKEKEWAKSIFGSNVPAEWRATIEELTSDGVPIPKGFTYVTGTKTTGTVIKDDKGNEFVWVPATDSTYLRDFKFPSYGDTASYTRDDELPTGIEHETYDVKKYGGFYIARYEAGVPDGDITPSNKTGVPVSKKGAIVWTNINYINAKASAESMISNEYVQTGLLTGRAWDTACHFIEEVVLSLTDSRTYGNYTNSESPANVTGYAQKQLTGYSDNWSVKNIYDLAGNVWEWTNEAVNSYRVCRGGAYNVVGYSVIDPNFPVSYRLNKDDLSLTYESIGFRTRLYIK